MAEALLLDTHVLIWWFAMPERLSATVLNCLAEPATTVWVSAASAWEIATKHRLGKLPTARVLLDDYETLLGGQGFQSLAITPRHGLRAGGYGVDHRDPFDRLLAAQAELNQLTLVSCDPAFQQFPCGVLW
jgi:PIN domain nuclease of toxin-antitoxin system